MTTKQCILQKCPQCDLRFQPVDWLDWRTKGFCSEKCFVADETPKFERWFAECILLGLDAEECPDDYVWNLQKPGAWLVMFRAGDTPEEAILAHFYSDDESQAQIQLLQ